MNNKVLLLNLNWRDLKKVGRMSKMESGMPLELLYIAGSLKKLEIKFKLIDLWVSDKRLSDYFEEISQAGIMVVNTAPSYLYWRDGTIDCELPKKMAGKIKHINPKLKIILIGPHGTVLPESVVSKDIDYIIRGEPDILTAKLISNMIHGKAENLKGVCKQGKTKFSTSKDCAIVENLDTLEAPYEILDLDAYLIPKYPGEPGKKIIAAYYEASRGCPYNCSFCFREGFRGKLRFKSISKIYAELKKLKKLGVNYIYFIDECFGFDSPWFKEVLKILKEFRIKWGCQTRPHLWNSGRIIEAAKSGCVSMEFGIESVNRRILHTLNKEPADPNLLKENINAMISSGIIPGLSFIIGSPYETKKTIKETRDYALQFPQDRIMVGCHIMLPYPKTKLWELGLREGIPLKGWGDIKTYAGIIHNDFKKPGEVNLEVKRFLSYLRAKKALNKMKQGLAKPAPMQFLKNFGVFAISTVIITVPQMASLFEKTLNLFKTGKFMADDYL